MVSARILRFLGFVLPVLAANMVAAVAQDHPIAALDTDYQRSFAKWKAELVEDRKQNWLPLVGMFWLKPGENSFGADPANAVVIPTSLGRARAGTFLLQGREVTINLQPGVGASIGGKAVTTAKLDPDVSGHPSVIELGSLRMHVIQRGERTGIRVKDLKNPAIAKYVGPTFYPLDPVFRVPATWVPSDGRRVVQVPNVLGDVTATPVVGEVRFNLAGQQASLLAVAGDAAHGVFLIFNDPTRKTETYPAGRFLDTDPIKDGKVILDFNRAYNPPCSVTPYATCPLPPKENQLGMEVKAGEKYDRSHASH